MSGERKPVWEETWTVVEKHFPGDVFPTLVVEVPGDFYYFNDFEHERTRLISAAPDMARALICHLREVHGRVDLQPETDVELLTRLDDVDCSCRPMIDALKKAGVRA